MPNFTKTYIERLPHPGTGAQALYWDDGQPGLGLRVTSGSKVFVFQARLNGHVIRTTVGDCQTWKIDKARERARELMVMVDKGIDPRQVAKDTAEQNVTLGDAFERFKKERPLKPRTLADYQYYLDRYFDDWSKRPLKRIDSDMVGKRYQELIARAGPAQASVAMRMLRSLFNFAKATYGKSVVTENPVSSLTAKRAWLRGNVRTDHLRSHEVKPFVEALRAWENPIMGAYLEFVLLTGGRRSEAAQLRWSDVDEKARVFTFKDTKNHSDRLMPITPRVAELLVAMKKQKFGPYVFSSIGRNDKPTHISEPRKALAAANAAASSAVTTHGLRRTYATLLESLDCPAYPLKALLGHSMRGDVTTAHYTQITVERLRPWAEKYEQHIVTLLADAPALKSPCRQKKDAARPRKSSQ